jgi:hypothetical protein
MCSTTWPSTLPCWSPLLRGQMLEHQGQVGGASVVAVTQVAGWCPIRSHWGRGGGSGDGAEENEDHDHTTGVL